MSPTPTLPPLDAVIEIARAAGEVILQVYRSDFTVRDKADASPVTEADERAERVITAALRTLAPHIPIVAEEAVSAGETPACGERFWLVDPLDGTREFVRRNGEFTVNVALVDAGQPRLGVVYAPALGQLYAGVVDGEAFVETSGARRSIRARTPPPEGLTVVASRSHSDAAQLEDFLRTHRVAGLTHAGSSLKLCLIAAGSADLYPRLGPTMEWDIAAGHAVLAAAGGQVCDLEGQPLQYGKQDFRNPCLIAWGAGPHPTVAPAQR